MATFVSASLDQTKNADSITLPGVTPTVGNNLVLVVNCWADGTDDISAMTVTDDEGNTWDIDVREGDVDSDQHIVVAKLNDVPSYTTSIVITVNAGSVPGLANAWWGAVVLEYSGNDFTLEAFDTNTDNNANPFAGPSVTGDDLTIAGMSHEGNFQTLDLNSGTGSWTERAEQEGVSNGQPQSVADSPSTGTINAEWGTDGNTDYVSVVVTYSEAGGGAAIVKVQSESLGLADANLHPRGLVRVVAD
jgi:hypothetical protein